jgi:hypothetical protein
VISLEVMTKLQSHLKHQPRPLHVLTDICPQIFPFTGDCGIKVPLPVTETPFLGLKVFFDDDLIN